MIRAMSHRFRMPPGGSALQCWLNPSNCERIALPILESLDALERYRRRRAEVRANPPTAAKGGFPYYRSGENA